MYGKDQRFLLPFLLERPFQEKKSLSVLPEGNSSFLLFFFAGLDFFLFPHQAEIGKKRRKKRNQIINFSPATQDAVSKNFDIVFALLLINFSYASLIFPLFFLGKKADILFFEFEFSRRRPGAVLRGLPRRPHQSRSLAQLVHRLSGKQDDLQGFIQKNKNTY